MTYEQLVEHVERTLERTLEGAAFKPNELPLASRAKYLVAAREVIEELQFAKPQFVVTGHDDLAFRYAVRAALGMNDKCGLTGLEKDVAKVHRIALRLRTVLEGLSTHIGGSPDALAYWETEAGAALDDAQFPRLWG